MSLNRDDWLGIAGALLVVSSIACVGMTIQAVWLVQTNGQLREAIEEARRSIDVCRTGLTRADAKLELVDQWLDAANPRGFATPVKTTSAATSRTENGQ